MQEVTNSAPHTLILENRKTLNISGITDIDRFDEKEIVLYTKTGELTITGRELHINTISIENGNISVEGDIWGIQYGDKDQQSPASVFRRLFK